MSRCVVMQPSYLPWRGMVHQFLLADHVVFYDDVQFDKGGWRNRNRIQTSQGPIWLTIPVLHKGHLAEHRPLRDIRMAGDGRWARKHQRSIEQSYARAPFFDSYVDALRTFYSEPGDLLADFAIRLTTWLCEQFDDRPRSFHRSSRMQIEGGKTGRLVEICRRLDCDRYLTGPSALSYLDLEEFRQAEIEVEIMRYEYPEYPQLHEPFCGEVSCLDLLMMTGPDAPNYLEPDRGEPFDSTSRAERSD